MVSLGLLEVGIDILEVGTQFIHCRAVNKRMHTRCLITVIYGDYDIIPRRELWSALRTLSTGIQNERWLILGDFNAVIDDHSRSRSMALFTVSSKVDGDFDRVILYHLIFLCYKEPDHLIPSGAAATATALDCVGFQEGSLPIKYLGIPLTSSRLTIADCRPLIDKVDTRLAGWHHQNLSYAGRLQLIKSVISTLHTYWASVFILPKGILKMLERKMRTFLWQGPSGGGQAKVAWEQICKPKAEGGLGMRSLIIMNQALILKQMWRILQNDGSSIWVDWIQRYRLRHSTLWTFNRTTGSWCWKKMLKLRPLLQRGVHYKVGDGSSFSLAGSLARTGSPLHQFSTGH
ncbi:UNVERIFIED_CONTAM: hypothetical protein Scaly_3129600 [Sesamum calycinum]|uniref:Reverse transcriptase n=1 Tax=Sesamum calycinum TaxID=2727403 RepID=A0AAW2JIL3_9LAMI